MMPSTKGATESLVERERAARAAAATQEGPDDPTPRDVSANAVRERERPALQRGAGRADPRFFFQTQHGKYANKRWGARWTGWIHNR